MKTCGFIFPPKILAFYKTIYVVAVLLYFLFFIPVSAYAANITLAWDANQESDLKGYILYYGTSSRSYTNNIDVGNKTQHTVSDLQSGVTYYFAVTAYNNANLESDYSVEVTKDIVEDSDNDGVPDNQDAFPLDPEEYLDTDGDGEGNNADSDDDNDGLPDDWELAYGLDPLRDDADADLDGDDVCNINEYNLGTAPNHNESNFKPKKPLLLAPENGTTVSLTPQLEADEFSDPNVNDNHSKTRWVITRAFDNVCVFDVTTDTSLTSLTVPKQILEEDTEYIWKIKFIDNHESASVWSTEKEFVTDIMADDANGNGIPDPQEIEPSLDLDEDGIPDSAQSDIKCVRVVGESTLIGISVRDAESVQSIVAVSSDNMSDITSLTRTIGQTDDFPFGLISFKLIVYQPGDEVTVTIHLSKAASQDGIWYKYNPVDDIWYDYSAYAEFSEDRKKVYLTLTDGSIGDIDGIANGIIIDPLGFSVPSSATSTLENSDGAESGGGGGGSGCFVAIVSDDIKSNCNYFVWKYKRELGIILTILLLLTVLRQRFKVHYFFLTGVLNSKHSSLVD